MAVAVGDVLDHVFERDQLIRLAQQGVEARPHLALTGPSDFMVVHLDDQTDRGEHLADLAAQIGEGIHGRDREVAPFHPAAMTGVAAFEAPSRAPRRLDRVDLEKGLAHRDFIAHPIEDEELRLGTEEGLVSDPARLQIRLGTPRHSPRTAGVRL